MVLGFRFDGFRDTAPIIQWIYTRGFLLMGPRVLCFGSNHLGLWIAKSWKMKSK